MKQILFILFLTTCGTQSRNSTASPEATPNPNAVREPSLELCLTIEANLSGFYIIDFAPGEALLLDHTDGYYLFAGGIMSQVTEPSLQLGSYCTLEFTNKKLSGVVF